MSQLGSRLFDAANHYYEATDAFPRRVDPSLQKRGMQWGTIDGKLRLLVAGKVNRFIPTPTFDPIAKPGCLDEYFRGRSPANDIRGAFGELEPIRPEYRNRDARLELMDAQDMEGCFLFPTLGVGKEQALPDDPVAAHGVFEAFNRWLEDDWGYAFEDRLFAAPYFTLLDPDAAVRELDRVLEHGARIICMRAGPIMHPSGRRSPGHRFYDP